jgi:hypothetical protein
MFIKDSDLIDINVYYRKRGNRYSAYTESEFGLTKLREDEKKHFKILSLKMKELTWGLYNQLQEDAMVEDINGNPQFNVKTYKENRLLKLIHKWDAVDEDDKAVPVNNSSISHLAPDIAETILRAYDEFSFISKDEEGK